MSNPASLTRTQGLDKNPANINREGRPKGTRNRSTIAKFILSLDFVVPDKIQKALENEFPGMPKKLSTEEIMTLVQARKAITDKDTAAYKALMDSAHGAPKQEHEHTRKEPLTINVIRDRNQNK